MNYPQESDVGSHGLRRQLVLTWILMGLMAIFFVWPTVKWWLGVGINTEPRAVTPRGALADFEKTTVEIFEQVSPSVVYVNVSSRVISPYGRRAIEVASGTGSGFIWDEAGHVVTNFHVIREASSARVVLFDQSSYDATLVGASPDHDLAVLKVNAPAAQIRPVAIGESHSLAVGQSVFAIGNPFGLTQTLSTGVLSALSRTIGGPNERPIEDVIQIDADINRGNSGGPLLDSAGRLIGVNTAIYSPTGTSAGIGFAIPVDTVNRVVPQLIANGRYQAPRLGIQVNSQLSAAVTRRLDVSGVLVLGVQSNSGAAAAGLRGTEIGQSSVASLGDIIQKVGDRSVENMNDLTLALEDYSPGDSVTVEFLRDGRSQAAEITLE